MFSSERNFTSQNFLGKKSAEHARALPRAGEAVVPLGQMLLIFAKSQMNQTLVEKTIGKLHFPSHVFPQTESSILVRGQTQQVPGCWSPCPSVHPEPSSYWSQKKTIVGSIRAVVPSSDAEWIPTGTQWAGGVWLGQSCRDPVPCKVLERLLQQYNTINNNSIKYSGAERAFLM